MGSDFVKNVIIYLFFCMILLIENYKCYDDQQQFYGQTNHNENERFDEFADVRGVSVEVPCEFRDGGRHCNCGFRNDEMVLPRMSGNIYQILVINCKTLRIPENAFVGTTMLNSIGLTNIEDLILEQYSLTFPKSTLSSKIQLTFTNTIIEEIPSYAFSGNIDVIIFDNCKIGVIHSFAISSFIGVAYKLSIRNTTINRIISQAVKKITVEYLEIQDSIVLSDMPSRAVYDLEVTQAFQIINSTFPSLAYGTFVFQDVNSLELRQNVFQQLNGGALRMHIRERINIVNNTIQNCSRSAFQAITLSNDYFQRYSEPMVFTFNMNIIEIMDRPIELEFNNQFNLIFSNLYFIEPITCSVFSQQQLADNHFLNQYGNTIYFKMPDYSMDSDANFQYYTFGEIASQECTQNSYIIYIIIGASVIGGIIIVIIIICLICWHRRKKQKQKLDIVLPESKTYRETQIVLQIENAGLLKTDL